MPKPPRRLDLGGAGRRLDLAAPVGRLATELQVGNAERAQLYRSARWRRERRAFLAAHPVCATRGCGAASVVVDHLDGHRHANWLARFWDVSRWQPLCLACHAAKSAAELADWRRSGESTARRQDRR